MKQDRNGVRTAQDLERKYNFVEKFSSIEKAVKQSEQSITKVSNELDTFVEVTTNNLEEIKEQIDGKITTYYYSGVPTLSNYPTNEWAVEDYENHVGDLYYDKDTGLAYKFLYDNETNEYLWRKETNAEMSEALALANSALDTADRKRQIFLVQPTPPYDNGDLWIKDREIYICQISKPEGETFSSDDFINNLKYTDDTLATQVGDNLEVVRGTVTTIQTGVDAFKIDIESQVKTINDLQEETIEAMERMSYTFGTKDFTIANSNEPFNARMNNQGLRVYTYNNLNSIFNHRGAGISKLIVIGDTQLANVSIVKTVDEYGNPCTDINHLVSNIQDLTDLEVD